MPFFLAVFLFAVSSFSLFAQELPQTIPLSKKKLSGQTGIAVSPLRPNEMVLIGHVSGLYYSSDSGRTWKEAEIKRLSGTIRNPVLYSDKKGIFYYSYLFEPAGKENQDSSGHILIHRSADGGKTWSNGTAAGGNRGKMLDGLRISLDESVLSRHRGRQFLIWTEHDKYGSQAPEDKSGILLSYSGYGAGFSRPVLVSDSLGDCLGGNNTVAGGAAVMGQYGEIYVVWAARENIYMDISYGGGEAFGWDRIIARQRGGRNLPLKHLSGGVTGGPFLAADLSQGPHRGWIYVVFADRRNGPADIWMLASGDMGQTWTEKQINTRQRKDSGDCFLPNICVNTKTGKIGIAYYKRDPANFFIAPVLTVLDGPDAGPEKGIVHRPLEPFFASPGRDVSFANHIELDDFEDDFAVSWTSFSENSLRVKVSRPGVRAEKPPSVAAGYNEETGSIQLLNVSGEAARIKIQGKKYVEEIMLPPDHKAPVKVTREGGFVPGIYKVHIKTPSAVTKFKLKIPE
jgi:hypothetical protein